MSKMQFKLTMGARSTEGRRLCDSCKWGLVGRGAAESEVFVYCDWINRPIPIRVTECTRFDSTVDPTLEQMEEMAFLLRTTSKRLKVGFAAAANDAVEPVRD